jgi:hypothetical protein
VGRADNDVLHYGAPLSRWGGKRRPDRRWTAPCVVESRCVRCGARWL